VCGGYSRDRTFIPHAATKDVQRAFFLPYAKPTPLALPGSINRGAIESQCKNLFWDLYMPQGDAECRDDFIIRCGHPMNWTEVIQKTNKQDASLQEAFSALSISRVGQGHKDVRLVHESTKMYGKALKELQLALHDPTRAFSDQILMACMLLGLYEVFEGPAFDSQTWMAHTSGAAQLVQHRGPRRHQHWEAHHPFLASRIPTVYAAIQQRRATYLATPEWLTVPWEFQHRTYFDRMVDLSTHVPGILERFDILRDSSADTSLQLFQLLAECKDLQTKMNKWRENTKKGAMPRHVPHDATDTDYPFETDLWFNNHLFIHARLVYYTVSLALSDAGLQIMHALSLHDQKFPPWLDSTTLRTLFDADNQAKNITQCVAYCLQPEMGAWGANIINFPANLARAYFQQTQNNLAYTWLTKAFAAAKSRGLHAEMVFNQMINAHDKDNRMTFLKRESSTETTSEGGSPDSSGSGGSGGSGKSGGGLSAVSAATSIFVYEDPGKGYYDASNDPD
jgi:hypothetical protein